MGKAGRLAVLMVLLAGCGGEETTPEAVVEDGGVEDSASETAVVPDTDVEDTQVDSTIVDTTVEDTAVADTSVEDTAVADTTVVDTALPDADAGSEDSLVVDSADDVFAMDTADTSVPADTADTAVAADTADTAVADAADSAADASDASTTSAGLIWFMGDYSTDGYDSMGNFNILTSGGSGFTLSRGLGAKVDADGFDVSPTQYAVSGDTEVAGRVDLSVIDRATFTRTTLVAPPGTQDVKRVRFSPDYSMIAFESDLATAGQFDIYVVPSAGGTPKRVSPTRPSTGIATDYQPLYFEWSGDSKYLAIVGDLEVDSVEQLWITDVTAATPTPVTALTATKAGTVGIESKPAWTGAGKVLFRGFLSGDTTRGLYQVDVDGTNLKRVPNAPLSGNIGMFGVSPDGTKVAFASDRTLANAYEIYVMPLDGTSSWLRITDGTVKAGRNPNTNELLKWSPDGKWVAFCSDYVADSKWEPTVVPSAGGGQKRVAAIGGGVNQVARMLAWSPDSTMLALIADHRVLGTVEAFRITNVTTADQTPILVHDVTLNGDMSFITWLPF